MRLHSVSRQLSALLALALMALALPLLPAQDVYADSFTVTNLNASGPNSLPAAIDAANSHTGADTITFASGLTGIITLASGLTISDTTGTTMITGPGTNLLTVTGSSSFNAFTVNASASLAISGVTISGAFNAIINSGSVTVTDSVINGNANDGIFNNDSGTVTASHSTFNSNSVGIGADGSVTVANSTFTSNFFAGISGGEFIMATVTSSFFGSNGNGIINIGTVTVTNSAFGNNNPAIYNHIGGTTTVTNSTIRNGPTGILNNGGTVTVKNCTISDNTTTGIYNASTLNVGNSIIAGNATNIANFSTFSDLGHNYTGDTPLLAPFANYGGPTSAYALLPGSPAIDQGDSAACNALTDGQGNPLTTDQRGSGFARTVNGVCDIGAFESQGFTLTKVAANDNQSTVITTPFPHPLSLTVASAHSEPVDGGEVGFTLPPQTGASATFTGTAPGCTVSPNMRTATCTIASGIATTPTLTANSIPGSFTATDTTTGASPSIPFALINTLASTTTTAQNATTPFSSSVRAITLTATVNSSFDTVNVGTVTFSLFQGVTLIGSPVTSPTVTGGAASVSYPLPANAAATTYRIQTVYNAGGNFDTSQDTTHTLTITPTTLTLAPQTLPAGIVPTAYSQTLTASGGSGTGYTFTLSGGSLPAGMHLSDTGALTGTPTTAGTSTFTVMATDSANNIGVRTYTLTINPAPLLSIAVTPANTLLKVGQGQQYTAMGTYADNSTADLTSQVTWSSDTAMASVDTSGKVMGQAPGTAQITATQGNVTGQASVTVTGGTSVGIAPGAAPASRPGGVNAPSGGGPAASPTPAPIPTGR